jgi:putative mycofactocin binding protein MftB
VVFTDPKRSNVKGLQESHGYVVSPHVRVRKEEFGLLFYNTQNTRLTFVRSGGLFEIKTLTRGEKTIIAANEATDRRKLKKTLDNLVNKGLIFEA